MVMQAFTLAGTALCFGIMFQVPPRYLMHTIIIGTIGALFHRALVPISELHFAAVLAAFLIGSMSHVVARITRQPAQIFLVPGVIVLVPGSKIYRAMSQSFSHEFANSAAAIPTILLTAVSITFGLLLANWLVPSRKEL